MTDLDPALRGRLIAAGADPAAATGPWPAAWEAWLLLHERWGRRATLVDLYQLEAARRGIAPEQLTAAQRQHLKDLSREVRRGGPVEILAGSDRHGDPHEIRRYEHAWPALFARWRDRLAAALGPVAARIEHVGSTSVPGLAAKPVVDIQVSVPDTADEPSFLPPLTACGLILRLRERGHLLLWPPPGRPRDVHVHVCAPGSSWEHDHLLFRDYLRAHPAAAARYATLKSDLVRNWREDRKAYGDAKTAFVLDTLEAAAGWAGATGWRP